MMAATLHTINIRLSPEQILFTINHARDDAILVHEDFVPVLTQIQDRIERPVKLILVSERETPAALPDGFVAEYEAMLGAAEPGFAFADFGAVVSVNGRARTATPRASCRSSCAWV